MKQDHHSLTRRNNDWLYSRFKHVWDTYYADTPEGYPITVRFGRPARYRFGSICNVNSECRILINGLFADPEVPDYVVDATLAHELAHYVHGYGSGLPKLHAHPHRGGVIDKEMGKRGCLFLEDMASAWRKEYWPPFYAAKQAHVAARAAEREQQMDRSWARYLGRPGYRTESDLRRRALAISAALGLKSPSFEVRWLLASPRKTGLSYRSMAGDTVSVHALLADPAVPDHVVDYELSYWLAAEKAGTTNWYTVEAELKRAGLWNHCTRAISWRGRSWPRWRKKHFAH